MGLRDYLLPVTFYTTSLAGPFSVCFERLKIYFPSFCYAWTDDLLLPVVIQNKPNKKQVVLG